MESTDYAYKHNLQDSYSAVTILEGPPTGKLYLIYHYHHLERQFNINVHHLIAPSQAV